MKRTLISLAVSGAVLATAIFATNAFFSDVETSTGNFFTAGNLDLKIDSTAHYAGMICTTNNVWAEEVLGSSTRKDLLDTACTGTWSLKDLAQEKFFSFADVKPGDQGENTISIHPQNNDAWACIDIKNLQNLDNTHLAPEIAAGDTAENNVGELADNIYFFAWKDTNGDNIWNGNEPKLFTNTMGPASDILNGKTYTLADGGFGTPLPGGVATNIGLRWCAGKMTVNEVDKLVVCDGSSMDNKSQSDSVTADIAFRVEQSRNNPGFRCDNTHKLVLENETINPSGPWIVKNDNIGGLLTWTGDANEFNFTLTAQGLPINTPYSLIYYADPYPGNHPGKLIWTVSTDGAGTINTSGSPDLGMNLPQAADANAAIGAKIWLIPSANYNGVDSVTTWAPDNTWLFEGNVYIKYDDTDH